MLDRLFPHSAQRARTPLMRPLGESSLFCRALSVRLSVEKEKKKGDSGDVIAMVVCLEPLDGFAPPRNMTHKLEKWHLIVIRNIYYHC